jgi:hypothetical protein
VTGTVSASIEVEPGRGSSARTDAIEAVRRSGLVEHLARAAGGPFGQTSLTLGFLEALIDAAELGISAGERLRSVMLDELSAGAASFALPPLGPEHRRLVAAFELVVVADELSRRMDAAGGAPDVTGALESDGLAELLEAEGEPRDRFARVLRLARAYAERQSAGHAAPDSSGGDALAARRPGERGPVAGVVAFFLLLRRAVIDLAHTSAVRPLVTALEARRVRVGGVAYRGLEAQETSLGASGLLAVTLDDIVGNEDFLRAGTRLARDVAGFDLERGRNPKRFNPVLFGLGRPGSGKTVAAHAVGNFFLEHCRERRVPARFLVVRRTDWASSYQNASAQNLVRLFREEVHGFDGVCGVYWPDIDTAFASRDSAQLRQEEKQDLGAVFGVFDGTLIPRDGKWFLICDANTLHMDEATISRIAQSPVRVDGPTTVEHYARLMRGILLRDLGRFLPGDDAAWRRIAEAARDMELSGRNVESICANLRSHIQDFELPDEYFSAAPDEKDRIVASLGRPADETLITKQVQDYAAFRRQAETEAEQARFVSEVEAIVRRLNASRAAAAIAGPDEHRGPGGGA